MPTPTLRNRLSSTSSRLVLCALIPLIMLSVFAVQQYSGYAQSGSQATELQGQVALLNKLVAFHLAMVREVDQTGMAKGGEAANIPEAQMRDIMGVPVRYDLSGARAMTDAALAAVPESERPVSAQALTAVRTRIDTSTDTVQGGLLNDAKAVIGRSERRAFTMIDKIRYGASRLSQAGMSRAADVVDASLRTTLSGVGLVQTVAAFWYGDSNSVGVKHATLAQMVGEYRDALDELAGYDEAAIRSQLARVIAPNSFDATLDAALAGERPVLTGNNHGVGPMLEGGLARQGVLDEMSRTAIGHLSALASQTAENAHRATRAALVLLTSLVALALFMAAIIGRSISRPVRRLMEHMDQVGQGRLQAEPLSPQGPPEIRHATLVFNDLLSNLNLLERKVTAIASCDFEADALNESIPGPIGESLVQSAELLSGSIQDRESLRTRLRHMASHDGLTGLYNKEASFEVFDELIRTGRREGGGVSAIVIGVEEPGGGVHGLGSSDEIIRQCAVRLRESVSQAGVLGRIDRSTFLVAFSDLTEPGELVGRCREVLDALSRPLWVGMQQTELICSAGIATDRGEDHAERVVSNAVSARARVSGRAGAIGMYDEELEQLLVRQAEIEAALREELNDGGRHLKLFYQPILDAETHELASLEALIRWDRPGHGLVPPDSFIGVAEASDLIIDLDRWVFRTAFDQLYQWSQEGCFDGVSVAVNVSGRHVVSPRFVEHVLEAVEGSKVPADRLILEVTETVLVSDLESAARVLQQLRSIGVRVGMDDFGTGFTSIAHLRTLPVDEIKVDRSLVDAVLDDEGRTLVKVVNDLAEHLSVPTVAEGVESLEQALALREVGCTYLQGFYFSRPLPPDALRIWYTERNENTVESVTH